MKPRALTVAASAAVVSILLLLLLIDREGGTFVDASSCATVASWSELQQKIRNAKNLPIVFCPFVLTKPDGAPPIYVDSPDRRVKCSRPGACVLSGSSDPSVASTPSSPPPSPIMVVKGWKAQLTLEGFVFRNATACAFKVIPTSKKLHVLKNCDFVGNVLMDKVGNAGSGGAITTGPNTMLKVTGCGFRSNEAQIGGAVSHNGAFLEVQYSSFAANEAWKAGAMSIPSAASALRISHTSFTGNRASEGPIRLAQFPSHNVMVGSSVSGSSNGICNGFWRLDVSPPCIPFSAVPYQLGNLVQYENGILLSRGLTVEIIARRGRRVDYRSPLASASQSTIDFHDYPDGAAILPLKGGSYVYVSNSEDSSGRGGVYAVTFDPKGRIRNYKKLLGGTTLNCNGGLTPWKTWISCEEHSSGQCWQVHPTGKRRAQKTTLGGRVGGKFEAFTFDLRNKKYPKVSAFSASRVFETTYFCVSLNIIVAVSSFSYPKILR